MIQPLVPQAQAANPGQYGFAPCEGGVCAATGVRAAGVSAGFRRNPKRLDLALVVADEGSVCAATFTQNRFCAAPVTQHIGVRISCAKAANRASCAA
jgi:glutamate N-acetyltransferase/amino-acid N-acetyltransferase